MPRWSPAGRQLFYRNGGQIMAVPLQLAPTFRPGRPELLFEGDYSNGDDVAPDGKRLLMIKNIGPATTSQSDHLNIVLNWAEELKARVPPK
jgi:hypothetical protein